MVNGSRGWELQRLAQVNSLMLQYNGKKCSDYKYENLVANLQNTSIASSSMMRQWVYQTCTEYGFFRTSSQESSIFGSRFDVAYFSDLCIDVFGERFNEHLIASGIAALNDRYGGKSIATSNIVYFYGTTDPWHVLGKLETSNEVHDKVIVVEGVFHCANMMEASQNDPETLRAARKEINNLIGQWLDDSSGATKNVLNLYMLCSMWGILYLLGFLFK